MGVFKNLVTETSNIIIDGLYNDFSIGVNADEELELFNKGEYCEAVYNCLRYKTIEKLIEVCEPLMECYDFDDIYDLLYEYIIDDIKEYHEKLKAYAIWEE